MKAVKLGLFAGAAAFIGKVFYDFLRFAIAGVAGATMLVVWLVAFVWMVRAGILVL